MFAYYRNMSGSPCFSVNFEHKGSSMQISTNTVSAKGDPSLFLSTNIAAF